MRDNKRLICILVAWLLVLSSPAAVPAITRTLSVGTASGSPHEALVVPITVNDPEAVVAATFTLEYSSDLIVTVDTGFFDTFYDQVVPLETTGTPIEENGRTKFPLLGDSGDSLTDGYGNPLYFETPIFLETQSYYQPFLTNVGTAVTRRQAISAVRCLPAPPDADTVLFTLSVRLNSEAPEGPYDITIRPTHLDRQIAGYDPAGESIPLLLGSNLDAPEQSASFVLIDPVDYQGSTVDGRVDFTSINDDLDNDGLLDWWERKYYGNLTGTDGSGDPDGDFWSDRLEHDYEVANGISADPGTSGSPGGFPGVTATGLAVMFSGDQLTVGGTDAGPGDVLGVFDSDGILCGEFAVQTTGGYGPVAVYGDDPATLEDEGAAIGDTLTFVVYDAGSGSYFTITADMFFPAAVGTDPPHPHVPPKWTANADGWGLNIHLGHPPVADAGPDQTVDEQTLVTLNGTGSSDPDGDIVSYAWRQTGGPAVALSDTGIEKPTFSAPECGPEGVMLVFELKLTDTSGLSDTDTCTVNVRNIPNLPPEKPSIIYPRHIATGISLTPTFESDAFNDPDGDTHEKTRWQISKGNALFVSPSLVCDEITEASLTEWVVPSLTLESDTLYTVRVFYQDGRDWSPASDAVPFTTGNDGVIFSSGIDTADLIEEGEGVEIGGDFTDANGRPLNTDAVKVFKSKVGKTQIGIRVEGGSIVKCRSVNPKQLRTANGRIPHLPKGMIDFCLLLDHPGASAAVTFTYSDPIPQGMTWIKYDPNMGGFYDYFDFAPDGAVAFSPDRRSVTVTLTDGQVGDAYTHPDGMIFDPGGWGTLEISEGGNGGGGGSCFIRQLLSR